MLVKGGPGNFPVMNSFWEVKENKYSVNRETCSLQWSPINVMVFQITGNSTLCVTAHSDYWQKKNINATHYWHFVRRISRWSFDSHHDKSVMREMFRLLISCYPCDELSCYHRYHSILPIKLTEWRDGALFLVIGWNPNLLIKRNTTT